MAGRDIDDNEEDNRSKSIVKSIEQSSILEAINSSSANSKNNVEIKRAQAEAERNNRRLRELATSATGVKYSASDSDDFIYEDSITNPKTSSDQTKKIERINESLQLSKERARVAQDAHLANQSKLISSSLVGSILSGSRPNDLADMYGSSPSAATGPLREVFGNNPGLITAEMARKKRRELLSQQSLQKNIVKDLLASDIASGAIDPNNLSNLYKNPTKGVKAAGDLLKTSEGLGAIEFFISKEKEAKKADTVAIFAAEKKKKEEERTLERGMKLEEETSRKEASKTERVKKRTENLLEDDKERQFNQSLKYGAKAGLGALAAQSGYSDTKVFSVDQKNKLEEFSKAIEVMVSEISKATTVTEEQSKAQEELSKNYEHQKKLVGKIESLEKGDGGGKKGVAGFAKFVNTLGRAADAVSYVGIGSNIDKLNTQKGILADSAYLRNQSLAATQGDMSALLSKSYGVNDFAKGEGKEGRFRQGISSTVGAGLNAAEAGVQSAASGVGFLGGGAGKVVEVGLDAALGAIKQSVATAKGIPQTQVELQFRQLTREVLDGVLDPIYKAVQGFRDFSMQKSSSLSGAGKAGEGAFDAISPTFMKDSISNLSTEEVAGLTQRGVGSVGKDFLSDPTGMLKMASRVKDAGLSADQYFAIAARSADSGGGKGTADGIYALSEKFGMANEKGLNAISGAVSSMSSPYVSQGIEGGDAAVSSLNRALSNTQGLGLRDETRIAEAASSLNRIDDLAKNSSIDIASMQKMALMQDKFKGKSGVQQLALAQATPEKIKSILSMPEGQAKTNAMRAIGASNDKELKDLLGIESEVLATRVTTGLASAETSSEIKDFLSGKRSYKELSNDAAAILGQQGIGASASGTLSSSAEGVGKPKLTALGGGAGSAKNLERLANKTVGRLSEEGGDIVGGIEGLSAEAQKVFDTTESARSATAGNLAKVKNMDPNAVATKSSPKNIGELMDSEGMVKFNEGVSNFGKMISDQIPESFGKGGELIKKAILEAFGEAADSMKGKSGGRDHTPTGSSPKSTGNGTTFLPNWMK